MKPNSHLRVHSSLYIEDADFVHVSSSERGDSRLLPVEVVVGFGEATFCINLSVGQADALVTGITRALNDYRESHKSKEES